MALNISNILDLMDNDIQEAWEYNFFHPDACERVAQIALLLMPVVRKYLAELTSNGRKMDLLEIGLALTPRPEPEDVKTT